MRLAFLLVAAAALVACPGPTAVNEDGGVKNTDQDAADANVAAPDAAPPEAATPSIVFVDGLVDGTAQTTSGEFVDLSDVRVCVMDVSTQKYTTDHAQPYDTPMPLTNYPGIRQGSGLDLGPAGAQVQIDVYSTSGLESDSAWSPSTHLCSNMNCSSKGLPCVPHVTFTMTLGDDVNVLALVDDASTDGGSGVKLLEATFDDVTFNGAESSLWGTVVNFSGWHAGAQISASYGNTVTAAGTDVTLANPLADDTAASPAQISGDISQDFDTRGIRFDQFSGQQPFDRFGQTLDSIAYVANPSVTPPVFYDVRENFVFALVGDPNDATSVNANGGRDPQFNRRGLHVAAIPYATPRPKP